MAKGRTTFTLVQVFCCAAFTALWPLVWFPDFSEDDDTRPDDTPVNSTSSLYHYGEEYGYMRPGPARFTFTRPVCLRFKGEHEWPSEGEWLSFGGPAGCPIPPLTGGIDVGGRYLYAEDSALDITAEIERTDIHNTRD